MGHLSCPLCPRGFLGDVKELQQRVASVLSRALNCPICSEPQYGLHALHNHLNFHLPLEHYKQPGLTDNFILTRNNTATFSSELLPSEGLRPTHNNLLQKSESIPSLETLDIGDDRLSVDVSPPHSHLFNSPIGESSNSPSRKQVISRPSSQSSGGYDDYKNRDFSVTPSENYGCDMCGLVFSSEHFLSLHKDIVHKKSSIFTVDCKLCKRKFDDLESYRSHVRQSHSERRYFCDECPKTFKLKGSLAVHKRMYHDGNPSICPTCNKKFPSTARREFHERRCHTNSKSNFKTPPPVPSVLKNFTGTRKTLINNIPHENNPESIKSNFPSSMCSQISKSYTTPKMNLEDQSISERLIPDKVEPSFEGIVSMLNWRNEHSDVNQSLKLSNNIQTIPIFTNSGETVLSTLPFSMSSTQDDTFNMIPIVSTQNSSCYDPMKQILTHNLQMPDPHSAQNNILNQLISASSCSITSTKTLDNLVDLVSFPKDKTSQTVAQLEMSNSLLPYSNGSALNASPVSNNKTFESAQISTIETVDKPVLKSKNSSTSNKSKEGPLSEGKQWECDVCKKSFTTKYFLKKHKRLHTGETPYHCEECGKSFTFQQSYHKHILYHSDDKPHQCSYCGRSFKEMSTLHNHVRIHTGEKPFVCETCGKAFRQRVSYLVHLRIHTGAMPYSCPTCKMAFRYKVSLRSHKCDVNLISPVKSPSQMQDNVQESATDNTTLRSNESNHLSQISTSDGNISIKLPSIGSMNQILNKLNTVCSNDRGETLSSVAPVLSGTISQATTFGSSDESPSNRPLNNDVIQCEPSTGWARLPLQRKPIAGHVISPIQCEPITGQGILPIQCEPITGQEELPSTVVQHEVSEIDADSFFRSLFN